MSGLGLLDEVADLLSYACVLDRNILPLDCHWDPRSRSALQEGGSSAESYLVWRDLSA
jgi:hypothetical protein